MRKTGLSDACLADAIAEMEQGLIDADLGGHVVKKRVAIAARGKRGGARTLIGTNFQDRWFFLFGFGKNERSNIDRDELGALQEIARTLLALHDAQIETAIADGELLEISNGDQT